MATGTIEADRIIVESRFRRDFDEAANQELITSILKVGLLNAVVVEKTDEGLVLRAGERRLRAIKDLYALGQTFLYAGQPVPAGHVPFTLWSDLSPIRRLEIEVEENTIRKDFTWQERAAATDALMRLRTLQAEEFYQPPPTVSSLLPEVQKTRRSAVLSEVQADLVLARNLHLPQVAKAKSAKEALTFLKHKEREDKAIRLAELTGRDIVSRAFQCYHVDSITWMQEAAPEQFDCICTDPPYGINADNFGSSHKYSDIRTHSYSDSPELLADIIDRAPSLFYRVAKPAAHLYLFCDIDWFHTWRAALTEAGWKVFRTPLIWLKPTGFRLPWPEHGPQRKYELILYAMKGDRMVNFIAPDTLSPLTPAEAATTNPAIKPVPLFVELLRRSCQPGDSVFDPFCGSGPIFPAAHQLKLKAVGCEIDQKSFGDSIRRIRELEKAE